MGRKTKSLHSITIDGVGFSTRLYYNLNTDHIGIGTIHQYRDPIKTKHHREINKEKLKDQRKMRYESHRDPNISRKGSLEDRIRKSCINQRINREDFNGFATRDYVLPEWKCTKLNKKFTGSEMHHIMSGVVIFVPKYLHNRKCGISHNFKSGKGMEEMNRVAWDYLVGKFKSFQ